MIENNWKGSTYEEVESEIIEMARSALVESGGGKYVKKKAWWWDQQVQDTVKANKETFKNWITSGNEVDA